jgi:hypothetical protein
MNLKHVIVPLQHPFAVARARSNSWSELLHAGIRRAYASALSTGSVVPDHPLRLCGGSARDARGCQYCGMTDTRAEETRTVLRAGASKIWCIGAWLIGAGLVITQFVIGDTLTGIKGIAAVLLVGYVLWLILWSPSVTLSSSTITVRNFLRKWDIDWPSVLDLPLGMSLAVRTRDKVITVAAAPGRGSYQTGRAGAYGRFAQGSPDVAYRVREYWRRLKMAPKSAIILDGRPGVRPSWLAPEAVILVVLIALVVLSWVFVR